MSIEYKHAAIIEYLIKEYLESTIFTSIRGNRTHFHYLIIWIDFFADSDKSSSFSQFMYLVYWFSVLWKYMYHFLFYKQGSTKPARSPSISSSSSSQAPTSHPPTPPMNRAGGTMGRNAGSHYRTPAPPVAPPSVPSVPSQYGPGPNSYTVQTTGLPGTCNGKFKYV